MLDICAILLDHDVGETDDDTVNAATSRRLLSGDWGLWRTSRGTIETTRAELPALDLEPAERAIIDGRLTALWERIEEQPKSFRWKSRAKIGDRSKWYEEPEEIGHRTLD